MPGMLFIRKSLTYPEKPQTYGCLIAAILFISGIYVLDSGLIVAGFVFSLILSVILNSIFSAIFCYRTVSIDRNGTIQTGHCDKNLKNYKWDKTYDSYRKINLVSYNPGYTFDKYIDEKGEEIRRGKVKVKPKLSVYLGVVEYSIGNDKFSQAELWWLGKEISDFLGLELQVIYPTPKAPPEATCGGC